MAGNSRGSMWNRWDLHFHTPASYDYANKAVTNEEIVDSLKASRVRAVAITDHHVMDVARIRRLQELGGAELAVFPAIELRGDLGGKDSVHFIGVFSPDADLDDTWTKISAGMGITAADVRSKGDDRVYCDLREACELIHELGGITIIHAHGKASSVEGIANMPLFKAQLKMDLLAECIDVLELGKTDRQADYNDIVFPKIGFRLPMVIGSDNHNVRNYDPPPCWLKCEPTIRGLQMIIQEPQSRVDLSDVPAEIMRIEQSRAKYLQKLTFRSEAGSRGWFSGELAFNPGLVAVIGNKGNGKSALADVLALLGATKNGASFSFLNAERFCHPTSGRAGEFQAEIEWEDGEKKSRRLDEKVDAGEVELVKYLPQQHIERICNEVAAVEATEFEQELKGVIFSHVEDADRLGCRTLDELIGFRTSEKQKRIDTLLKELRDLSRSRSELEGQMNPARRSELEKLIDLRSRELKEVDALKPPAVPDPKEQPEMKQGDPALLSAVTAAGVTKVRLEKAISDCTGAIKLLERKGALVKLLLEKVGNFQKEYATFQTSLVDAAAELGIDATGLISITIRTEQLEQIRLASQEDIVKRRAELGTPDNPGLVDALERVSKEIIDLQSKLDEPNRQYQRYVLALAEWQKSRASLVGSASDSGSLEGLRATLAALANVPDQIRDVKANQARIALEILSQKLEQAEVLRRLYGPVQSFIDGHEIARNKLQLEFRVELVQTNFSDRLLGLLALNRRGSFMGLDEGRARSEEYVRISDWTDPASLAIFLETVDGALHQDLRANPPARVQLAEQLLAGKTPEDVYNMLYGLEYLRPRYLLRWEGKELSLLSPGERGTLLLVFYLLIDKGDLPLIIDQPEGNLDNHTVTKVLVDCIRAARNRRQVFIVTHNPNLAVVCDADQIIHASLDKANDNAITYTSGALEDPVMNEHVTDVLEGTRWAFDVRGGKYDIGGRVT